MQYIKENTHKNHLEIKNILKKHIPLPLVY